MTTVTEIAPKLYRISTPVPPEAIPGGFTFNQFLIVDDEPLLFHTGPKKMFPLVKDAVARVTDPSKLRWISFSHYEADECGSLNDWLELAPNAAPLCGMTAAMVSVNDTASRPARAVGDGEEVVLGAKRVRWIDAAHVPHNWETGFLFEATTRTLLCGDIFTQGGADVSPVTESEIVGPALATHQMGLSGMQVGPHTRAALEKLARTEPALLATMHGSSYRGDGARQLRDFATALGL